ncbi:MAG: isochorismatase [Thermoleophilia bacterium]|nr:isochorismatase [Thermoleophilia bacterium]
MTLPLPPHFDPGRAGEVWRVPYAERAAQAEEWAGAHRIGPAAADEPRVCLLAIDVQNTFCAPGFELFVGGRSGRAAVDDTVRLCEFLYRNLGRITRVIATLDTHLPFQVFHPGWLVDADGRHPEPYARITAADVGRGSWRIEAAVARTLGVEPGEAQDILARYTRELAAGGRYELTVWPYHALLGGIGHALVASFAEAVFFHAIARRSQPELRLKGATPFAEHYSALGPEVTVGPAGRRLGEPDRALVESLLSFDAIVVAGQAKSHCVARTVEDLLRHPDAAEAGLPERVYLLEDCTSPVVVPGAVDYTDEADAAFRRFAAAGARVVRSTEPPERWPGPGL